MKCNLIILTGLFILFACNNPKKARKEQADSTHKENNLNTDSITKLPNSFYKRLEGTIAGKRVTMHLQRVNGKFAGEYYYNGPWLALADYAKTTKDSIYLNERNLYASYFGPYEKYPKLTIAWTGTGFNGTWINGDRTKSYPIVLEEKYPEGSYKFSAGNFTDSLAAIANNPKSPVAEISFTYLKPEGDTDNIRWLDAQLKQLSGITSAATGRQAGFKTLSKNYFKDYASEVKQLSKNIAVNELKNLDYFSYNYQSIAFNDKNYIVIESLNEDYTGGAHGNYGTLMTCLDLKNKKRLGLSDVINIDSNVLQKLVEKNFRKLYNIKPDGDLKTVLFDNFIKPNTNFYFNQFGLAFMYNPYEVASYAQGQVVVFIPFTDLTGHLNPSFKARMGI